jgi:hypothetical protein
MATHYRVEPDGRVWREIYRQVGWIGQTGRLYLMGEDPSKTEPGSFSPIYQVIEADRVEIPEEMLS